MTDKLKTDRHYAIYEHLATIGEGPVAQRLVLLYFNRRPEDTAFLGELQHLEQQNKNFRMLGQ